LLDKGEPFFEGERGVNVERHAELDDGERNVGSGADDDGDGTAEAGHVRKVAGVQGRRAQSAGAEGVEGGDVDEYAPGPPAPDLLYDVFLEADELGVVKAAWIDAIRKSPRRRIETKITAGQRQLGSGW